MTHASIESAGNSASTARTSAGATGKPIAAVEVEPSFALWRRTSPTLKTFASGTDEATLKTLAAWLGDWYCGIVTNVAGDGPDSNTVIAHV